MPDGMFTGETWQPFVENDGAYWCGVPSDACGGRRNSAVLGRRNKMEGAL